MKRLLTGDSHPDRVWTRKRWPSQLFRREDKTKTSKRLKKSGIPILGVSVGSSCMLIDSGIAAPKSTAVFDPSKEGPPQRHCPAFSRRASQGREGSTVNSFN